MSSVVKLTDRRVSRTALFDLIEECASEKEAARWVLDARAYWVAEDMQALAFHAATESDQVRLYPQDIPCPSGFLAFERHVVGDFPLGGEVKGAVTSFGFAWRLAGAGVEIHELSEFTREDGTSYFCVADVDEPYLLTFGRPLSEHGPYHQWLTDDTETLWAVRIPAVTLLLLGQTLAARSRLSPDRATRRRALKHGRLEPADLTIITLRRVVRRRSDAESSPVDWHHRWIVNGHWRNQWHRGQRVHRSKWIAPYVKGPDDAPLIPKRHLSVLVR